MTANEPVSLGDSLRNVVKALKPEDSRQQHASVTAIGGVLSNPLFTWSNQAVEGTPLLQSLISQGPSVPPA